MRSLKLSRLETLTEHHRKQLIPTGIAFNVFVAFILLDDTQELELIKKCD